MFNIVDSLGGVFLNSLPSQLLFTTEQDRAAKALPPKIDFTAWEIHKARAERHKKHGNSSLENCL